MVDFPGQKLLWNRLCNRMIFLQLNAQICNVTTSVSAWVERKPSVFVSRATAWWEVQIPVNVSAASNIEFMFFTLNGLNNEKILLFQKTY